MPLATRFFGYSLVKIFVSPKKLKEFDFLINSPKSDIAMFVVGILMRDKIIAALHRLRGSGPDDKPGS